jgi:succinate dehydrogenase / fumarate reductase flavoprotein subunit
VFGARAGAAAAEKAKRTKFGWDETLIVASRHRFDKLRCAPASVDITPARLQAELQKLMWEQAGPFRNGENLTAALARLEEMQKQDLPVLSVGAERHFNLDLQDWLELRAMLTTAEAVVRSALGRTESRGAHQREDFPLADYRLLKNQVVELGNSEMTTRWVAPVRIDRSQALHA